MRACLPCAIYYYAPYEKIIHRKLQDKHPDDCSREDLEALFNAAGTVDPYTDVVRKSSATSTASGERLRSCQLQQPSFGNHLPEPLAGTLAAGHAQPAWHCLSRQGSAGSRPGNHLF